MVIITTKYKDNEATQKKAAIYADYVSFRAREKVVLQQS
jgi:hypothetical protein